MALRRKNNDLLEFFFISRQNKNDKQKIKSEICYTVHGVKVATRNQNLKGVRSPVQPSSIINTFVLRPHLACHFKKEKQFPKRRLLVK